MHELDAIGLTSRAGSMPKRSARLLLGQLAVLPASQFVFYLYETSFTAREFDVLIMASPHHGSFQLPWISLVYFYFHQIMDPITDKVHTNFLIALLAMVPPTNMKLVSFPTHLPDNLFSLGQDVH
jgi:hypothetical protein